MEENLDIKLGMTAWNKEENEKFKNIIRNTEQEIDFYRKVFRLKYTETDLEKYNKEKANRNEIQEKNFLLKVLQGLWKNPVIAKKLTKQIKTDSVI